MDIDETDIELLAILQRDGRASWAQLAEQVGLSSPSVMERVRKLEQAGVITGYHAMVDAEAVGLDIAAFVGVSVNFAKNGGAFEAMIAELPGVLECHHVTGRHTLLIKAKARNTAGLEALISRIRMLEGVERTDTMVVMSTQTERVTLPLEPSLATRKPKRKR